MMSKQRTAITSKVKKSKRLIHIKEFLLGKNLRIEQEAGFKAYVHYETYMTLEKWNRKLSEYLNK